MVPNPRRVLVVEESRADDPAVAEIAELLEVAGFAVRVAVPGEKPQEVAARYRPDVALISLADPAAAPGPAVGSIVSELERDYGVPVVVVESRTNGDGPASPPGDGESAAAPGAPVLTALSSVFHQREVRESPTLAAGDVVVDEAGRVALRADQPLDLTRLEFDLLAYFVRHRNHVLSRDALLAAVWHNEPVTPNAIEALVSKLRAKLDRHGPRLIHTVRGVGYVLRAEGTSPFDLRRHQMLSERDRLLRAREQLLARRDELRRQRMAAEVAAAERLAT